MTTPVPIICHTCGAQGSMALSRLTAGLQCRCGSKDIDLDDSLEVRTAAPHGPGTGWNTTQPNRLQGWDEYQGPTVGRNPLAEQHMTNNNNGICPACGGTGRDSRASGGGYDENTCRLCGGSGRYNPPTSQPEVESYDAHQGPASGGARWQGTATAMVNGNQVPVNYTATRRSSDPLGSAEDYIRPTTPGYGGRDESETDWGVSKHVRNRPDHDYQHGNEPLQLDQAPCPSCPHSSTQIIRNPQDHAIWHCPNCGPLADVDKNPEVDPYSPPFGFKPDRSIKMKALFSRKKTGRILAIAAKVQEKNPGLSPSQSFTLARKGIEVQKKAEESN